MGRTSFSGPVLGNADSGGGSLNGATIDVVNLFSVDTYINDFNNSDDYSALKFTATDIGTVTATPDVTSNPGCLTMNTDAADNEGHVIQTITEFIYPTSGRIVNFEAYVGIADADDMDVYIGIGETLITFMGATGALSGSAVNYAGFHFLQSEGTGIASCVAKGGSGSAVDAGNATTATVGDAVYGARAHTNFHRYGIKITNADTVEWFFNGHRVQSTTLSTAFDDAAAITLCSVGSGAATDVTIVDYIGVSQTRIPAS